MKMSIDGIRNHAIGSLKATRFNDLWDFLSRIMRKSQLGLSTASLEALRYDLFTGLM